MPRFMVESYPVGVSANQLTAATERAVQLSAEMRSDGLDIWVMGSTLIPAEDSLFCLFEAPSRGVVEDLVARAGLPLERIVEAVDVADAAQPERCQEVINEAHDR